MAFSCRTRPAAALASGAAGARRASLARASSTQGGAGARAPKLNAVSATITAPKSQGASQAMLYATGLTPEDMAKAQIGACGGRCVRGQHCGYGVPRNGCIATVPSLLFQSDGACPGCKVESA